MSDKHTPGPWWPIQGDQDEPDRWHIVAGKPIPYLVATVENGQPGDCLETECATARLIAAAPELLEALIKWDKIREWLEMDPYIRGYLSAEKPTLEGISAAIAKASGKEAA